LTIERIYLSLIGPSDATAEVLKVAEEAGAWIARAGAVLVTGGGRGAMEAACRGAKAAGGLTIGLLPGSSRSEGNRYLDVALPTGMGEMRNVLVVRTGDGVLAIGGGFGTLSELGLALKLGKPVVGIGTWEASAGGVPAPLPAAATAEAAVRMLLDAVSVPNIQLG
jgi:uncharacterized protein (TIGR00725 family)